MVEVSALTKTYGGNRGISDISFTVREGEIVGFLGPNGAGKTTTMNILAGYLTPTSGTASIAGTDILARPLAAKRHVGYLPEQPPLYTDMTVNEYLNFVYGIKGVRAPSRKEHIGAIAGLTDIESAGGRLIRNLSKGFKQRVGLAQALIGDPDVLILDEPTSGLDPRQIAEMRGVIKELGKSRTVILSTHILSEASAVCERVLVVSKGELVADAAPEKLTQSGEGRLLIRVAGPKGAVRGLLKGLTGVKSAEPAGEAEPRTHDFLVTPLADTDIRRGLFTALADAGYPILMMRPHALTLEEAFIKLTEEPPAHTGRKRPKKSGGTEGETR
ncbi:MAG: ABC transporter ATP-binding protein, partial [Oscillospiraceae bacterium]|jgi:ABC-2 type transport system ATP-binding protein|nr:ABC transporter ATP-binding protein [Oscillospiraceae bacterium]